MSIFTKVWWEEAAERAIKTFAQALATGIIGKGVVEATGANVPSILELNWPVLLGAATTMAVLSILTSIAGTNIGPKGTPSLVAPKAATSQSIGGDSKVQFGSTPEYSPVKGDVRAILPPGFDSSYRIPENKEDVIE